METHNALFGRLQPSTETTLPWISVLRREKKRPRQLSKAEAEQVMKTVTEPDKGGKWIIKTDQKHVDMLWDRTKRATIDGKLGPSSKVSTKAPTTFRKDDTTFMIVAYTDDARDEKDILRVKSELRRCGIDQMVFKKND